VGGGRGRGVSGIEVRGGSKKKTKHWSGGVCVWGRDGAGVRRGVWRGGDHGRESSHDTRVGGGGGYSV